jgi:SAM-dependent methyltransferase
MHLNDQQYRSVMRKGWNLTPALYERLWTPVLRTYSMGCLERVGIEQGHRVLDIASGPGTAAFLAAERVGPRGSVLGADISDNFVGMANAVADGRANVRFARHPMEALALADESFDAATCVLGLMYAAPPSEAFAEIARVLAPGGRFAGCVWGRREACVFREVFHILGQHLQMDVCPLFFALGVPGAFAAALERAGLVEAREERVDVTLRWRDRDEACAAMFDGGPGALPFSMFTEEMRRAVRDEFVASIEPYRRGSGFEVPAEFVYGTARKPEQMSGR